MTKVLYGAARHAKKHAFPYLLVCALAFIVVQQMSANERIADALTQVSSERQTEYVAQPPVASGKESAPPPTTRSVATQPATSQPTTATTKPVSPLIEEASNGLPAELSSQQLGSFSVAAERLRADIVTVSDEYTLYNSILARLDARQVLDVIWDRYMNGGFKDKQLPIFWAEMVNREYGVMSSFEELCQSLVAEGFFVVVDERMAEVRNHILANKVTVGDRIFVKAVRPVISAGLRRMQAGLFKAKNCQVRVAIEFPEESQRWGMGWRPEDIQALRQ